ncbi:MAG: hypothetical protein U0934_20730 [Pseudotabrizicola sp.]|uniref:hypothetical protein n=1 Tax=Pseudotabrizicola sp. TaxID=2939647 RepID=UPI002731458A|nr:hypothetical protein [Pseudotabrizicola sp.]MDZ7576352.1 hypothetical protein [Pseudotabrizicola sp.]
MAFEEFAHDPWAANLLKPSHNAKSPTALGALIVVNDNWEKLRHVLSNRQGV